jgi:hypothetical protein
MIRQLKEKNAVYSLGHELLNFTDIEHLEVWVEEGWLDARTHDPSTCSPSGLRPA